MDLIQKKMNQPKNVLLHKRSLINDMLLRAYDTLKIQHDNKYTAKLFPLFYDDINNVRYIVYTFSECLALLPRLKYNNLIIKIGNGIMLRIYLDRKYQNIISSHLTYEDFKSSNNIDFDILVKLGIYFVDLLSQFPHKIFNRVLPILREQESFYTKIPYELVMLKQNKI